MNALFPRRRRTAHVLAVWAVLGLVPALSAQSLPSWAEAGGGPPAFPNPLGGPGGPPGFPTPPGPPAGPPGFPLPPGAPQGPPGFPTAPTQVPADGGLALLALAGGAYAARRLRATLGRVAAPPPVR